MNEHDDSRNVNKVYIMSPLMKDSALLQIYQQVSGLSLAIARKVATTLQQKGYQTVSPSMLHFLGTLECDSNYAADIARHLNVTRQMVRKTVRELCAAGYLYLEQAEGRKKAIRFTPQGEQLMADARALLASYDKQLLMSMPPAKVKRLQEQLSILFETLK